MRILAWIIGLPLAVLAAIFAVANRHLVRLDLWPLPWSVDMPVYLAVLGALVIGITLGALVAGGSLLKAKGRAGTERRRADSLARQLDVARRDAETARAEADAAKAAALPAPAEK